MAYIVGIFRRDALERFKRDGYDICAEGTQAVEKFFKGYGKANPDEAEPLVNAVVFIDGDCEDFIPDQDVCFTCGGYLVPNNQFGSYCSQECADDQEL